jgi:hypothetical protein
LPDSPGRAARKLAGKKLFSLAGLSCFSASGRFMAGVAQRNKFQGLLLFWDPQNKMSVNSASTKAAIAAELAYKLILGHFD